MINKRTSRLISARVQCAQLLLDFWKRAVQDRKTEFARQVGVYRRDMLRALREKRGYEA